MAVTGWETFNKWLEEEMDTGKTRYKFIQENKGNLDDIWWAFSAGFSLGQSEEYKRFLNGK